MPNPADDVPTSVPVQIQNSRKKLDSHDGLDLMELLREKTVIRAKITAFSDRNYSDEYIADLYADGSVGISGDLVDTAKTHQDIRIYNPNIYRSYAVGDTLFVTLTKSKIGIIVDQPVPAGFFPVSLKSDGGNPGNSNSKVALTYTVWKLTTPFNQASYSDWQDSGDSPVQGNGGIVLAKSQIIFGDRLTVNVIPAKIGIAMYGSFTGTGSRIVDGPDPNLIVLANYEIPNADSSCVAGS